MLRKGGFSKVGYLDVALMKSRFRLTVKTFLLKDTSCVVKRSDAVVLHVWFFPSPCCKKNRLHFTVDMTCNAMDITYYQKEPSIYLFNKDNLSVNTRYLIVQHNNHDWRFVLVLYVDLLGHHGSGDKTHYARPVAKPQ